MPKQSHAPLTLSGTVHDREVVEEYKNGVTLAPATAATPEDEVLVVGGSRMMAAPITECPFQPGDTTLHEHSDAAGRFARAGLHANYGYSGYFKASVFDGAKWRNFKIWDFVAEEDRRYKTQADKQATRDKVVAAIAARAGARLSWGDRRYVLDGACLEAAPHGSSAVNQ